MKRAATPALCLLAAALAACALTGPPAPGVASRLRSMRSIRDRGPAGRDALPAVVAALDDADVSVRREAVLALGAVGPEAAGPLTRLVESGPTELRYLALYQLEEITPEKGLPDEAARRALVAALGAMESTQPLISLTAARVASKLARGAALDELLRQFRDGPAVRRQTAGRVLSAVGPAALPVAAGLFQLAEDGPAPLRPQALLTLVPLYDKFSPADAARLRAALLAARLHSDTAVRSAASHLQRLPAADWAKEAVPLLEGDLQDRRPDVRQQAVSLLSRAGNDALPALTRALLDARQPLGVRQNAASSLGSMAGGEKAVLAALRSKDRNTRQIALGLVTRVRLEGDDARAAVRALLVLSRERRPVRIGEPPLPTEGLLALQALAVRPGLPADQLALLVPAFVERLRQKDGAAVRPLVALLSRADLPKEATLEGLEALVEAARSTDYSTRLNAIRGLCDVAHKRPIPAGVADDLVALFESMPSSIDAMAALLEVAPRSPVCVQFWASRASYTYDSHGAYTTDFAVQRIGKPIVPALLAAVKVASSSNKLPLLKRLLLVAPEEAMPLLAEFAGDPNTYTSSKLDALRTLAMAGYPNRKLVALIVRGMSILPSGSDILDGPLQAEAGLAVDAVIRAEVERGNSYVSSYSEALLRRLGVRGVGLLRDRLERGSPAARRVALVLLERLGHRDEAALRAHASNLALYNASWYALQKSGPPGIQALREALRTARPAEAATMVRLLGTMGPEAAPMVVGAMRSPHKEVRLAAVQAFSTSPVDPRAVAGAARLLGDPDLAVRVAAVERLGAIKPLPPSVLLTLGQAARAPEAEVRRAFLRTLYSQPAGAGLAAWARLMDDPDEGVRSGAEAMGYWVRQAALEDAKGAARTATAVLLRRLKAKAPPPTRGLLLLADVVAPIIPDKEKPKLVAAIRPLTKSGLDGVRDRAVLALLAYGEKPLLAELFQAFQLSPDERGSQAVIALVSSPRADGKEVTRLARQAVEAVCARRGSGSGYEWAVLGAMLNGPHVQAEEATALVRRLLHAEMYSSGSTMAPYFARLGRAALPALVEAANLAPESRPYQFALHALRPYGGEARGAVGGLKRAALSSLDFYRYREAIITLEAIGRPAVAALAEVVDESRPTANPYVTSQRQQRAREAAQALSRLGTEARAAIPALVRLGDGVALARVARGDEAASRVVVASLAQGPSYVDESLLRAISSMGPEAIPALCDALDENLARYRESTKADRGDSYEQGNQRQRLFKFLRFLLARQNEYGSPLSVPWREPGQKEFDRAAMTLASLASGPLASGAGQLLLTLGPKARAAAGPAARALARLSPAPYDPPRLLHFLSVVGPSRPGHLRLFVSKLPSYPGPASKAIAAYGADAAPAVLEICRQLEAGGASPDEMISALGRIGPPAQAAVPALTRHLGHPSAYTRFLAAEALWRIEGRHRGLVPALVWLLDSRDLVWADSRDLLINYRDLEVRGAPLGLRAALLLGEMGPGAADVVPQLRKIAEEANQPKASFAEVALWGLVRDYKPSERALREAVFSNIGPLRRRAAEAIRKRGLAAAFVGGVVGLVPGNWERAAELAAALGVEREAAAATRGRYLGRDALAEFLKRLGPAGAEALASLPATGTTPAPRAAPPVVHQRLMAALHGGSAEPPLALARDLGSRGTPVHILLLPMMKDKSAGVRWAAAAALGAGPPATGSAYAALLRGAKDADAGVRRQAIESLGRVARDRPIGPLLLAALDDPAPEVACEAADAIASLGKPVVPTLVAALKGKHRALAIEALGALGRDGAEAAPALAALLGRPDGEAAARALGRIGGPAVATLTTALGDEKRKADALAALGAMGPAGLPAQAALVKVLEGPAVARALAGMGAGAVPALRAALRDPAKREWALFALERMGEPAGAALEDVLALEGAKERDIVRALARMGGPVLNRLGTIYLDAKAPLAKRRRAIAALAVMGDDGPMFERVGAGGSVEGFRGAPVDYNLRSAFYRDAPEPSLAGLHSLAHMNLVGSSGRDLRVLGGMLSHPWPEVRRRAALLYPVYYNAAQTSGLVRKNPDPEVRAILTVRVAGSTRPDAELLREAMGSRHAELREGAVRQAERWNIFPIPALRKRLADSSPDVRALAFQALSKAGPGALDRASLLAALKGTNPAARRVAAGALLVAGDYPKDQVEGIADLFADYNLYYTHRLTLTNSPVVRKMYGRLLAHPNAQVRQRVAMMLANRDSVPAAVLPAIEKALPAAGSSEKSYLYTALGKAGAAAVPVIERRLGADPYPAVNALRALGPAGWKALLKAMKHPNSSVRSYALSGAYYASRGQGQDVRKAMAEFLGRGTAYEKAQVVGYLVPGASGMEEVSQYLPYLRDASPYVREKAAAALAQLAVSAPQSKEGEAVYLALRKAAEAADWDTARAGVYGLWQMGPRARGAMPAVLARLQGATSAEERRFCLNALAGMVRDNEAPGTALAAFSAALRRELGGAGPGAQDVALYEAGALLRRKVLPEHEARRLVARLGAVCRRPDAAAQAAALRALAGVGEMARGALTDVEALLGHESGDLKVEAINLVWALEPASEKPWAAVLEVVKDTNSYRANVLLQSLVRTGRSFGTPGGGAVIGRLVRDLGNASRRSRAIERLRILGPNARGALAALFPLVPATYSARYAIGAIASTPDSMAQVGPFLRHPDSAVREAAHDVAYRHGTHALPYLLGALSDDDQQVAMRAASGLSSLGGRAKEAVPAMREAAKKAKGPLKSYIDSAIRSAGG